MTVMFRFAQVPVLAPPTRYLAVNVLAPAVSPVTQKAALSVGCWLFGPATMVTAALASTAAMVLAPLTAKLMYMKSVPDSSSEAERRTSAVVRVVTVTAGPGVVRLAYEVELLVSLVETRAPIGRAATIAAATKASVAIFVELSPGD